MKDLERVLVKPSRLRSAGVPRYAGWAVAEELGPTLEPPAASTSAVKRSLILITGQGVESRSLPESGIWTIGRASENEISIDDPQISRRHAAIHLSPDRIEIEDLGSANGTRVRAEPLVPGGRIELHPGEVVDVGASMLMIQLPWGPAGPSRLIPLSHLEVRLADECARSARGIRSPFAFGRMRLEGDIASVRIASILDRGLGGSGFAALYAPGELAILILDATRERAEQIVQEISDQIAAANGRATFGIACFPDDGFTAQALIGAASRRNAGASPSGEDDFRIIEDPAMLDLRRVIERVAQGTISVLLTGETGVGKEVIAELVHRSSPRRDARFVRFNCAALSEALVESELFGHERGAFTGAEKAKQGLFESAQGGTLFLDEVGELSAATQAKILRALEMREVLRVGSVDPRPIDVRFVSATNRDLEQEAAAGRFRQDLYYRLSGVSLQIPPLRMRRSEIGPLARAFAARAARDLGLPPPEITSEAMDLLERYSWPGNIRELRNIVERAVLLSREALIEAAHLPIDKLTLPLWSQGQRRPTSHLSEKESAIRARILEALERCAGNQTRAAKALGVSRQTLSTWLVRYEIPRPRK
jgi:two-component system, NtrC family, response regulator AtoC